MDTFSRFLSFLMAALLVQGCSPEPEFDLSPRLLGFDGGIGQGIRFKDVPNTIVDSLIIRVAFQDGDGNLGLTDNEPSEILREPFFPVLDAQGNYILYDAALEPVYDCKRYTFVDILTPDQRIRDTIRVDFNPSHYNFDVELLVKDGTVFREYDFRQESCRQPLSGRFPPLKEDLSDKKPLAGVIQYSFASAGLLTSFRNDTLIISVQIRDRSLQESNKVFSDPFTLRELAEVP
jgi:hypothetical protein